MDPVPFGSGAYCLCLGLLVLSRSMDLLSTWIATPNLMLEANPLARRLGWRWGVLFTLAVCLGAALWPLLAIIIATISVLVAARNFQQAWLMRSLGEAAYRSWMVERIRQASAGLHVLCTLAEALLVAGVGGALMAFSEYRPVPLAIGAGVVGYAFAVVFYTLLSLWRVRRRSS